MSDEQLRRRVDELEDRVGELESIVDELTGEILEEIRDLDEKTDMQLAIWQASEPELYEEAMDLRDDE